MFNWLLIILGCLSVIVFADPKTPAEGENSSAETVGVERRDWTEAAGDDDLSSLVSPSRSLRGSYVRFGRSPLSVDDADEKRANHYVRFGRDNSPTGRHYVRFGRSSQDVWLDDDEDEKRSATKHYVRFGRDGRHYVRFGRSFDSLMESDADAVEDDAVTEDKRSGSKHYVRFGRSVGDVLLRKKRSSGNKHYVRFGRSDADKRSAGKHYVRFGRSDGQDLIDDEVEDVDKRSGKHYVRFGRQAASSQDEEKRSKHYVRFGRSDQAADDDTLTDKRANYVRFG